VEREMPKDLSLTPEAATEFIVTEARALAEKLGRRVAVGIAGAPGVGKSTIAASVVVRLNAATPGVAALVPMDGFHMRHKKLIDLRIVEAKGAPHTFEGAAFAAFLLRLRTAKGPVKGPGFDRAAEDVVEDAFTVGPDAKILVVEGNYLLLKDPPWNGVRPMLDLAVFIAVPRDKVRARLIRRHGENPAFTAERNERHVDGVDMVNYDLVSGSRPRADLAIDLDTSL